MNKKRVMSSVNAHILACNGICNRSLTTSKNKMKRAPTLEVHLPLLEKVTKLVSHASEELPYIPAISCFPRNDSLNQVFLIKQWISFFSFFLLQ